MTSRRRDGLAPDLYRLYVLVGLAATVAMLFAIPVVAAVGPMAVDWPVLWATFAVSSAVTAAIALLPWKRLVRRQLGQWVLDAWSLLDLGAIGALVAATGGDQSWFWVLFMLTTIFFSAGYPWRAQLLLMGATVVTLGASVAEAGSSLTTASFGWKLSVLVAGYLLASFPAWLLRREAAARDRARLEADRLAARLEQSEIWWRSVIEHTGDPIVVLGEHWEIMLANPAFEDLVGHTVEDAGKLGLWSFVHPDDLRALSDSAHGSADAGIPGCASYRVLRGGNTWRHMEVNMSPVRLGDEQLLICSLHDVTLRVEAQTALTYQATHDSLTGLANRRAFYAILERSLSVARRASLPLAVLVLDLDDFKDANDTFGHAAGDRILQETSHRLEQVLREADVVARVGGDEFAAVLTTGGDRSGATMAAERVLEALEAPMSVHDHRHDATISVGVAVWPDHGDTADQLLRRADEAMYAAKRSRQRLAIHDGKVPVKAVISGRRRTVQ